MLMVCATVVQAFLFTMLSRFIVGITIGELGYFLDLVRVWG